MNFLFSKMTMIFSIIFLLICQGNSQTIHKLSVFQAIELGLKNSIDLKNLNLDYKIQEQKNKELTAAIYPTVSATGGLTYYTNVPKIQFPSSNKSVYDVLQTEGVKNKDGNVIDANNATFSVNAVSFIQPWNTQIGVSVNQLIFQSDVFVGLQARKTILEFNQGNINVANENLKEKIYKAYYAVLIAQKQGEVMTATKIRLASLLNDMTEMYKTGFAEKLDIDKIQVSLNNAESGQNQISNALKIGMASFKTTLGISQSDSIVLTENLDVNEMKVDLLGIEDFKYEKRSEVSLLNTALELQKLDYKRYKLAYLPSLAAFYQIQRSGQKPAIANQLGEHPWFWFNTGLVGLQLNVPIYSGNKRKFLMAQSKFAEEKVINNITQVKQYIDLEQEVAKNSLSNAIINLEVQERNRKLAEEVFKLTKIKYENGLGSSFEVLQADTELQRAEGNYFQALYEGMLARTSYAKAFAKL
ncbi:MAG: TolC family protein [Saprospiraceae bacterium]|nr:TolC family protein [Saprospiraceae bacterium]